MNHSEIKLSYRGELQFNTVIEIIRNYDAIQEEYQLAFRKYKKMAILDLVFRAAVYAGVMNRVIKSYCRFNHYAMRDSMINRSAIADKYSMSPEIETW